MEALKVEMLITLFLNIFSLTSAEENMTKLEKSV
jgi:hypothetical protein